MCVTFIVCKNTRSHTCLVLAERVQSSHTKTLTVPPIWCSRLVSMETMVGGSSCYGLRDSFNIEAGHATRNGKETWNVSTPVTSSHILSQIQLHYTIRLLFSLSGRNEYHGLHTAGETLAQVGDQQSSDQFFDQRIVVDYGPTCINRGTFQGLRPSKERVQFNAY